MRSSASRFNHSPLAYEILSIKRHSDSDFAAELFAGRTNDANSEISAKLSPGAGCQGKVCPDARKDSLR